MSWSPDLFIGEFRPWPDTVQVVRGTYDDTRRYVPEDALVHMELHECPVCANVADLQDAMDENARLRSCLTDDAENARMIMAENAKLRELVRHLRECTRHNVCAACEYADDVCDFDYDLRELGIEVVER